MEDVYTDIQSIDLVQLILIISACQEAEKRKQTDI